VELAVNSVPIAAASEKTPVTPAEPNLLLPISLGAAALVVLALGVFALRRRILS
jgi:hypothetical protein